MDSVYQNICVDSAYWKKCQGMVEGTDTEFEAQPRLWWHLGVCGVTVMAENEVPISIISWYHEIDLSTRRR